MSRSSASLCVLAALLLAGDANGHDFWLQPSMFRVAPASTVSLRFLIGEPGAGEPWETEWRKIVAFQDYGPDMVSDQLGALRPLNGAKPTLDRIDASIRLTAPGTHMLAFTSAQSLSDLPADRFDNYARHEGLAAVLADRRTRGATNARGRELYSRRAKALVQVGGDATGNVTRRVGHTLELVPDQNPYALKDGAPLRLRVWFNGSPLSGASVVLEDVGAGATHDTPVLSDAGGYVAFRMRRGTALKANVVWSYPIADPRADYETIFCSLVFGGAS